MMRQTVNHGRRHLVVGEETAPLRAREVRGQDEAPGLVAVGDDAEQPRRAVPVHGDIPPLVEDEPGGPLEVLLEALEGTRAARCAEAEHEVGDREEADGVPLLTSADTQGDGQVAYHGNRRGVAQTKAGGNKVLTVGTAR